MTTGTLLNAARESAKGTVSLALVTLALCAIIYAISWKYVFNSVSGPVPFTAALAANPGAREFVTVEGPFISTGIIQESALKLKRIRLGSFKTADYKAANVGGRMVLVKLPTDFTGNSAAGSLEPLPTELAELANSEKLHPWIISEGNYRLHANLFVLIAFLLTPFGILLLIVGLRRVAHPEKCSVVRGLKRFGPQEEVLAGIEAEIAASGGPKENEAITLTPSWVVVWKPLLDVFARTEVSGVGVMPVNKSSNAPVGNPGRITIWVRGRYGTTEVKATESEKPELIAKLRAQFPRAMVTAPEKFSKRWPRLMNSTEISLSDLSHMENVSEELVSDLADFGKRHEDVLSTGIGAIKAGAKELIPGWAREFARAEVFYLTTKSEPDAPFVFGPEEDRNYFAVFSRKELAEATLREMKEFNVLESILSINGLHLLRAAKSSRRGIWLNPLNEKIGGKFPAEHIDTLIELAESFRKGN
jgi:hypothetical protein